MLGYIKYFNRMTGYGIILYNLSKIQKEIIFRYTEIGNIEYNKLTEMLEVEFKVENERLKNAKVIYR